MSKPLVVVESPTKVRTIKKYLGSDYNVAAPVGHIKDLPSKDLGIDIENDFTPIYIVSDSSKKQVRLLKQRLKEVDELLLATDEDREGEAIAWHLLEELKPKVPVQRMVFHEITKKAIQEAADNPRDLDVPLVQAQETRRILDRLFGFEVSPVL